VPAPARLVSGLRRPQAHINLLCMPDLMVAKLAAVARNGGYFAWGGCADGAAGASADGPGGLSSDRGVVTFSAKGAPTMRYISM
jgi:hypothetical protein